VRAAKSRPRTRALPRRRRVARRAAFLVLAVVLVAGLAIGRRLRVDHRRVRVGLPAPVRIAVLGDFHIAVGGYGGGLARAAVAETMGQRPDLIILVGDFVSGKPGIRHIREALYGLHAPLGVYAVQGNHEHWTDARAVRKELEALGVRVLINENLVVRKGGTRLVLVGIDDLWVGRVDWRAAFRGVPEGAPVVLISHNPDAALHCEAHRAALVLSGHTHGGLIGPARPLLRAVNALTGHGLPPGTRYGRSHLSGLFRERWGWVYVTSGVVPGIIPPRWFLHPEVGVLDVS
jgi:predicted MPP superfamily phosphohydrolase